MNRLPALLIVSLLLSAGCAAAAPTLDLTLPRDYLQTLSPAKPARGGTSSAPSGAPVPPRTRNDAGLHPHVWGSATTAVGYGSGIGSSFWQGANVNAAQSLDASRNPLVITGGVAGALGYSHAFGTTQWEGAHVEMSKLFGGRHPFAFTLGIAVSRERSLGNGSWFQQTPAP